MDRDMTVHERFISEVYGRWYLFDPNVRDEGFGPFTMEQAECVKMAADGETPYSRAHFRAAVVNCPELRWVLDS